MDVSVVIPSAGKLPRLEQGLRSLAAQRLPPGVRWEVVLVADGVDLREDLAAICPNVRVVRASVAAGRGAARNRGVREAAGDTVILLDDDMVVVDDFVASHWAHQGAQPSLCRGPVRELMALVNVRAFDPLAFVEGLSAPAAARIEPRVRAVIAALSDPAQCFLAFGQESRLTAQGAEAFAAGRRAAAWVAFAGANLSAPRDWLLRAPFDERAGTRWGLEDLALALRWLLDGRPLATAEGARALHLSHARGQWKADLEASLEELSFLPLPAARAVVDYLKGDAPLEAVEDRVLPLVMAAPPASGGARSHSSLASYE